MYEMSLLVFPNIDPVAVHLGPLVIRWYALAYLVGIVGGWWLIGKLNARVTAGFPTPMLSKDALDDLVFWATLGIILGGRVGYVLFYNLPYFLSNPSQALAVWKGGMSFHGGLAGVLLASLLFCRKYKQNWLQLMDMVAVVTPLGLLLGRLANFINGELYGRIADASVPWAMVFPRPEAGPLPRHPSQLYEAGLEGLLLLVVLCTLAFATRARDRVGLLGGLFLLGYGLARGFVEFFREPDAQLGLLSAGLSMGQWLCVPMIVAGGALVIRALARPSLGMPQ